MQTTGTRKPSIRLGHLRLLRPLAALVVLGAYAACDGMPEGADDRSTETTSQALTDNGFYTPGQPIVGKQVGPAATVFQQKAFFAYVRTDNKIGIIIDTNLSSSGGQSATSYALTDTTTYGPCLVVYQNQLNLIYVDSSRHLALKTSSDGANWAGPWVIDWSSFSFQPSAVDYNGTLHVFAIVNNGSNNVLEVQWNGSSEIKASFPGASVISNHGPYAAVWNGLMYLTWAGTASSNPIYISHAGTGLWTLPTLVSNNWGLPALWVNSSQQMEMVYRGNDAHIYRLYTTDGVSFGQPIKDNASTTNFTPIPFMGIGQAHPSTAWVFYTGQNSEFFTRLE